VPFAVSPAKVTELLWQWAGGILAVQRCCNLISFQQSSAQVILGLHQKGFCPLRTYEGTGANGHCFQLAFSSSNGHKQ